MSVYRHIFSAIEFRLFKGKLVVLQGARQVGKTTLAKALLQKFPEGSLYLTCDDPDVREAFHQKTLAYMKHFLGDLRLLVLDEAQRVPNIGITLKLLVDGWPELQVIATGSSSFELGQTLREPLTGRKFEFWIPTLTMNELTDHYGNLETRRSLEHRILYGTYPEVVTLGGPAGKERLQEISRDYLYKDLLAFGSIRNPEALQKLLQALALQIGQEVSFPELAATVGIDKNTVQQYIRILEEACVIFQLPPYARNRRNELKKLRKVFFWDTGIRNAILGNFQQLDLRIDKGALWENFLLSERLKALSNQLRHVKPHFWRTTSQQEIDYIEEEEDNLRAFEIKWSPVRWKIPSGFTESYPTTPCLQVNNENWEHFAFGR